MSQESRQAIREIKKLGKGGRKEIRKIAKDGIKTERAARIAASRPPTRLGRAGATTGEVLMIAEAVAGIAAAAVSFMAAYRELQPKKTETTPSTE